MPQQARDAFVNLLYPHSSATYTNGTPPGPLEIVITARFSGPTVPVVPDPVRRVVVSRGAAAKTGLDPLDLSTLLAGCGYVLQGYWVWSFLVARVSVEC